MSTLQEAEGRGRRRQDAETGAGRDGEGDHQDQQQRRSRPPASPSMRQEADGGRRQQRRDSAEIRSADERGGERIHPENGSAARQWRSGNLADDEVRSFALRRC